MNSHDVEAPDPEDMFNDTRMSFGDHIEDLRTHLWRAVKGFLIGMVVCIWPLGQYSLGIIVNPVEEQLNKFEQRKLAKDAEEAKRKLNAGQITIPSIRVAMKINRRDWQALKDGKEPVLDMTLAGIGQLLSDLKATDVLTEENRKAFGVAQQQQGAVSLPAEISDPLEFSNQVQRIMQQVSGRRLATMNITEAFMVYLKVAALTGLILTSPWVFWQIWMFIAAGLYPHEKRIVHVYLPFSLFLFLTGVVVCQFLVMPRAIEAMLWFNEWLGLDADLRLNEWLGFALMMPVVFGLSFQTPLVMMFIHRIGLVRVQTFRDKRRISWFVMAVFAALITPSVDVVSMLFLWVPMGGLYELGILLCVYQGEEEEIEEGEVEEKTSELVEV